MIDAVVHTVASALVAVPVTIGLGIVYFTVAAWVVDALRLNYGERPVGFRVLNFALALTLLSYFFVFAVALRRF